MIHETIIDCRQVPEKSVLDVHVQSAMSIKCRLTNMSGSEGQFYLDCSYEPGEEQ